MTTAAAGVTATDMPPTVAVVATVESVVATMESVATVPETAIGETEAESVTRIIGVIHPVISVSDVSIVSGIDAVRRAARKKCCHRYGANHCCNPFHRHFL
jgi:hypothetical protein